MTDPLSYAPAMRRQRHRPLAIAAFVFGVLSWVASVDSLRIRPRRPSSIELAIEIACGGAILLCPMAGITCGIVALWKGNSKRTLAITGIIMSATTLLLVLGLVVWLVRSQR